MRFAVSGPMPEVVHELHGEWSNWDDLHNTQRLQELQQRSKDPVAKTSYGVKNVAETGGPPPRAHGRNSFHWQPQVLPHICHIHLRFHGMQLRFHGNLQRNFPSSTCAASCKFPTKTGMGAFSSAATSCMVDTRQHLPAVVWKPRQHFSILPCFAMGSAVAQLFCEFRVSWPSWARRRDP